MSEESTDLETFAGQQKTYQGFMKIVKWSVISMVVVMVFLYVVINP